jgi:5-methylcytosine-specific restriction endonuclease McrA
MGAIRKHTKRHKWSDAEVAYLVANYSSAPMEEIENVIGLHRRTIQCKANWLGLAREKKPKRGLDQIREAKRRHMAEKRAKDIEAAREYQRKWRLRNADRVNERLRHSVKRRLFWGRALRLRGVSPFDLWKLWKSQQGKCALSGRKLDRSAEIDHKLPKVRGGKDTIANLQWVTREANRAKRDLTDVEFLRLCRDCAEWIGERIAEVDGWTDAAPETITTGGPA